MSLQATPLDPHLLLSGFFSSSMSFVLMTPGWPLKIAALCYPQLQNSISFRGLITIWNGLTCLLVKGLSSSLDCRLNEDRVLVWEEEHRTQSISRINGSEWWVESEGQHSGQHPSSTPPPITHPLTSGPCAVRSQPPPTRPQPSRCRFSHTPAMASNISGPLCSCIPVPEFCPHPAPSQAFGKWTGCKEKPVPPSPSSSHLPYRHARARARTHTHIREAWLGFHKWRHKLPNRYNSGFILRSETPGLSLPSCFPGESVLGLSLELLLKPSWVSLREAWATAAQDMRGDQFSAVSVCDRGHWVTSYVTLHWTFNTAQHELHHKNQKIQIWCLQKEMTKISFPRDQTDHAEMGVGNTHWLHLKGHFPGWSLDLVIRELIPLELHLLGTF